MATTPSRRDCMIAHPCKRPVDYVISVDERMIVNHLGAIDEAWLQDNSGGNRSALIDPS